jgi:hypothetical protein
MMICAGFVGVLDTAIIAMGKDIQKWKYAAYVMEWGSVLIVREPAESGSTNTELILVLGFLH